MRTFTFFEDFILSLPIKCLCFPKYTAYHQFAWLSNPTLDYIRSAPTSRDHQFNPINCPVHSVSKTGEIHPESIWNSSQSSPFLCSVCWLWPMVSKTNWNCLFDDLTNFIIIIIFQLFHCRPIQEMWSSMAIAGCAMSTVASRKFQPKDSKKDIVYKLEHKSCYHFLLE